MSYEHVWADMEQLQARADALHLEQEAARLKRAAVALQMHATLLARVAAAEKKYSDLLAQTIRHEDAVAAGMLTLALAKDSKDETGQT